MGYKSISLFQECSSNIQRKLIFITARNISSRFLNFKIKNRRRSMLVLAQRLEQTHKCALTGIN
ncbi:hypothetical protein FV119_11465 [Staphylococcus aureus]|nr:hypothetical protein CPZ22_14055 [Staphylococcus aureus]PSM81153.1 hypothetical protein B9Y41_14035 [Staphylococcus aureus]TXO01087.1 hypothetical protein FV119_11465 [Staphylococcus aureus]